MPKRVRANTGERPVVAPSIPEERSHRGPLRAAAAAAALILALVAAWRWSAPRGDDAVHLDEQKAMGGEAPSPAAAAAELLGLDPEPPTTVEALREEALAVCERLVARFSRRPEAHAAMAMTRKLLGDTEGALEAWRQCLHLNPRFGPAYMAMGGIAHDRGEHERAVELIRRALPLQPEAHSPYRYRQLVAVLLQLNRNEEALAVAEQFAEQVPDAPDSHYWLGQVHLELRQYEEAKRSHAEAVRIDPRFTHSYFGLSVACARLGERELAADYRQRFAELNEEALQEDVHRLREYSDVLVSQNATAGAHLMAGRLELQLGNPQRAEAHWLRGAAAAPKETSCRELLVAWYEAEGRPARALDVVEEVLAAQPDAAGWWMRAGQLRARMGERTAAAEAYRRASELDARAAALVQALEAEPASAAQDDLVRRSSRSANQKLPTEPPTVARGDRDE